LFVRHQFFCPSSRAVVAYQADEQFERLDTAVQICESRDFVGWIVGSDRQLTLILFVIEATPVRRQTFEGESDDELVFVLGWGNRIDHENVQWLIDELRSEYRVSVFELPDTIDDFVEEYVLPVERYVDRLDSFRLLGHSTGGLIGPYIEGAETRTYLSPWWGYDERQQGLALTLLRKLPLSVPILPTEANDRDVIGELATDRQLAEGAGRAAPSFLREILYAQRALPPIAKNTVVFCTLRDRLVSTRAIGERVPPERIHLYDGGHELLSSSEREQRLDALLDAVRDGPGALERVEPKR